ncbi:hypothetical protein HPB52_006113 [Rhipicephalus sanguineus]|uniref:Uncharacterized protein n=1 Tax=Rhipicephalus sanguineus TaxID=34632 RepID=A0A9D4T8U0_RHISA|nr:hypothetical protein HPB52_006113 [Rhipicephalus sanguineus]
MSVCISDDTSAAVTEARESSSIRSSFGQHHIHFKNERCTFTELSSHTGEAEVAGSSQPPARLPLRSEEYDRTPDGVLGRRLERTHRAEQEHRNTEVLLDGSVLLRSGNTQIRINPLRAAWDSWYDQNRHYTTLCLRVLRYCAPVLLVTLAVLGVIFWMATHGFRYAMLMPSPRVKASV